MFHWSKSVRCMQRLACKVLNLTKPTHVSVRAASIYSLWFHRQALTLRISLDSKQTVAVLLSELLFKTHFLNYSAMADGGVEIAP